MKGLPPIVLEDVQVFDDALATLLAQTGAVAAMVIDQGGPVIAQAGDARRFNAASLAAVAAGAFAATSAVALLMGETQVSSFCQQGQSLGMFVNRIDDNLLLLVIFKSDLISPESVRNHSVGACDGIGRQVERARKRSPGVAIDVAGLDMPDVSNLFRRKK
jgi:predicted regulator of Ras-like GTPase activity (Roadblock/LC7/MglB family)